MAHTYTAHACTRTHAAHTRTHAGVTYIKEVQLPGGTIELRSQDVSIENSFFLNMNYFGKAALNFAAMRATLLNSTFVSNNNSAGARVGAW